MFGNNFQNIYHHHHCSAPFMHSILQATLFSICLVAGCLRQSPDQCCTVSKMGGSEGGSKYKYLTAAGGERGRQTDSARPAVFRSLVDLNGSTDSTLTLTTPPEDHAQFEAGRAEAIGALCAIFSSQPCGEPFLPVYLARFYRCLHLGLKHDEVCLLSQ